MDTFFPMYLLSMLTEFSQYFSKPNYEYFKAYIWSMMINTASKCMTNTAQACFFMGKHVSSFERFLSENKWDINQVKKKMIEILLTRLYPNLVIHNALLATYDTTLAEKASKEMVSLQKWHTNTGTADKHALIFGHHWGIIGLICRHPIRFICFPIFARLISGQKNQQQWIGGPEGVRPVNFWDTALAAIDELRSYIPSFLKLRLVCDAYFSKAPFLKELRSRSIHLISRLRKDAKGWDQILPVPGKRKPGRPKTKGQEWKLADLVKMPLQSVTVQLYGEMKTLQVFVRDVYLRDFKELVRVVVIQTATSPVLLVSTDLALTAQQIIEIYGARFSIEISIRDLKQHFGFTDYQCYSTLAFFRFVSLACISFCSWMLVLLHNQDEFLLHSQASSFHSESPLSFSRVKRAFKKFVCQQIISQKFSLHEDFEKINSELQPLLAVA
jgi:hypothetical protein